MPSTDSTLTVETHDGERMPAFVALPASGSGPGLVLLQEIFGITDYIKSRARDLAEQGYVVVAPELYWRIGPHVATDERTEAGLQEAFGYFGKLDVAQAVDDAIATLEHVRAMHETDGAADPYLPPDQAERIRASFQDHPDAEIHMHADAGHAFDNFRAPIFYHQSAADEAWPQTQAFLEQHFAPGVPSS